jgi:hypothetical protein
MKKLFTAIICIIILGSVTPALAQTQLAGTTWEFVAFTAEGVEYPADTAGVAMTLQFGTNGRYTITSSLEDAPQGGAYTQSGDNVTLDPGSESEARGSIRDNRLSLDADEAALIFELTSGSQPPAQQPDGGGQQSPAQQPDSQQQGDIQLAGTKWKVVAEIDANGTRKTVRGETLEFKEDGTVVSDHEEHGVNTFLYVQSGNTVAIAGTIQGKIEKGLLYLYIGSGRTEYQQAGGIDFMGLLRSYWWIPASLIVGFFVVRPLIIKANKKVVSSTAAPPAVYPPAAPPITPVAPPMTPINPMPATMPIQQPAATPSATSHLICTKGHYAGATFPINGRLTIGRDPKQCQLVFPNETKGISALHCEIRQQGSSVTLTDMGSTYGTFLTGRKLNPNESATLKSGDSFHLADGKNEFKML